MHCARCPVCFLSSWRKEGLIFVCHSVGEQTSKIIVYQFCTDNPLVKHAQLVIIHVIALYTRWVMSCLPRLFIEESRTSICPPFGGTANNHCLILWSVKLLYHTGFFRTLYPQQRNRKNCCHGNTSCMILLKKLTSSYSCRGLEC